MVCFTFEIIAILILYFIPTVYALIKEKESYYFFDIVERVSNKAVLIAKIVIAIVSSIIFFGAVDLNTKEQVLSIEAALFALPLVLFNYMLAGRRRSFSEIYKKIDTGISVVILILVCIGIIYSECIK